MRYVENVRYYYELLVRITEPELLQDGAHTGQWDRRSKGPGFYLGDSIESAF